jgi:hypothetical protein
MKFFSFVQGNCTTYIVLLHRKNYIIIMNKKSLLL